MLLTNSTPLKIDFLFNRLYTT